MSDYLLASTNLSGKQPRDIGRNAIVLEQWGAINSLLSQRYGDKHANLLAAPETEDGLKYDWYTNYGGQSIFAGDLTEKELESLKTVALERLDDIRRYAESLSRDSKSSKEQGEILQAAIKGLDFGIPDNLYSVDGQPVFVNWGVHQTKPHTDPGTTEVARNEKIIKKSPVTYNFGGINLLWLVFVAISTAIFWRLVEGCALFAILGGGFPNFCHPVLADVPIELNELLIEHKELENEVELLQRRLLATPLCSYTSKSDGGDSKRTSSSDISTDSGLESLTDIEINSLLSDLENDKCEGVEVIAVWDGASDIDLHAYCPILPDGTDRLSETRMVGPGNPESCGVIYDIQSEGNLSRNIERICLTKEAEAGDYLIAVYHDTIDVPGVSIPVHLSVRGSLVSDKMVINSNPGNEAEAMMPIHIEE